MTSDIAIAKIEEMIASGLRPTPQDIIRINAFGLAIDAAAGKNVSESLEHLPRVAVLKKGVFLRQPTIGHEIWISSVIRFVDRSDPLTLLAVHCFALSRPQSELPDAADPENVKTAISGFCETMGDFTREQLYVAHDWVKFGMDAGALEETAQFDDDASASQLAAKESPIPSYDHASCVALGSLYRGSAVLWGLTLSDLRSMTSDQIRLACRIAANHQHVELDDGVRVAQGEFEDVVCEITARLEKEKSSTPLKS